MLLVFLGYMGSGKSHIGADLASKLNYEFIDLDQFIERVEQRSISQIFKEKGEIYFRKLERKILEELLESESRCILSLGGGTPCYFDNMQLLKSHDNCISFYLKVNIPVLVKRLFPERQKRPLISHIKSEDLLFEFIGKHLFERKDFYEQADYIMDVSDMDADQIIERIILQLF